MSHILPILSVTPGGRVAILATLPPRLTVINSISVPGPTRGLWLLAVLFCFCGSWASAQSPGSLIRPGDFSAGLKGWWKLDEASGTRMDSSGNGNHLGDASSVGSVSENYWSSSEASADFEFSDSDGLSRAVAGTGLDISGPSALLTLAAWVKIESHPTATRIVISQGPLASDGTVTLQDTAMPNDAAFYRIVVTGP